MAKLENNQLVKNRRGDIGCVVSFNGEPSMIVYKSYTFNISRLDNKLKAKNENYDIVEVHKSDGITFSDVFKSGLKIGEETLVKKYR